MATLTFTPASIAKTLHVASAPARIRHGRIVQQPHSSERFETHTLTLAVSGANASLVASEITPNANPELIEGGTPPSWLSCPASSVDGVAFTLTIDTSDIQVVGSTPVRKAALVTATADGFDDATCRIDIELRPE